MDAPPTLPEDLTRRYQPRRVLGRGSFGEVVEAADLELDREVAIKLLRAELQDAEQAARFAREGRLTSQLRHPHVVACYDHGVAEDGTPYLVYELIQGESLDDRLRRVGPRPPEEVRQVGVAIAEALEAAHAAGILHRDVKPENILLRRDRSPVLCDFGVAACEQPDAVQTAEGIILGTLEYMAPELMLGVPASPATDAFALAATLYRLRFGESPYPGVDPGGLARIAQRGPGPRPPATKAADEALDQILLRATAPRPEQRYPDLAGLRAALGGAAPGRVEGTVVLDASSPGLAGIGTVALARPTPPPRRRGLIPWVLGGLGVAALAGTGWWWLGRPPPPPVAASAPAARAPVVPEVLRDAWLRFAGYRAGPEGRFTRAYGTSRHRTEHLEELSAAILDSRFELRASRFLEALRAWLEGSEDLEGPEARDFLIQVASVLAWIARDIEVAAVQGGLGLRNLENQNLGFEDTLRSIDKAIDFNRPFSHLARELKTTSDLVARLGKPPAAMLLRAVWTGPYNGEDSPAVVPDLWRVFHARGGEDPVLAAALLPWIARVLLSDSPGQIDCDEVVGQVEEIMAHATRRDLAPGYEVRLLRDLSRIAARVAGYCDRAGLKLDWAGLGGAMRRAENAPLAGVRSLTDIHSGLGLARDTARDLTPPGEAPPPLLAVIDAWVERRHACRPILRWNQDAFLLPVGLTEEVAAYRLDEAQGALARAPSPEAVQELAVALVLWVEQRRLAAPATMLEDATRLRIQDALEALAGQLATATPETARWIDAAVVRLAPATPPMDPCLAGTLRTLFRRRQLPDPTWLPAAPCLE